MEQEVVERLREMHDHFREHYASRIALLEFREDVALQFGAVHTEIAGVKTQIAELETRLIKWFIGTSIAIATLNAGLMFGLLKLLR